MMSFKTLQEKVATSELGQNCINEPLFYQDIWDLTRLSYSEEELRLTGCRKIYFRNYSLPWLKLLAKLTALAVARKKLSVGNVRRKVSHLKQLDSFLTFKGYTDPELITNSLLQEFISGRNEHLSTVNFIAKLWSEEQWLNLSYTPRKHHIRTAKVEIIPENLLHQIYENFDLFPPPLERMFRLQIALGCRIGELLIMPRQCLKQEDGKYFLKRWIEKRKLWKYYQIHPLVAEVVREQQSFLNSQFGKDSNFDKLFCRLSTASQHSGVRAPRFDATPVYTPEVFHRSIISDWLKEFSEKIHLKDEDGKVFSLQSHMFRRTKASVMAYCEAEDEYIAAVLGHSSLDMLPHYRKRSSKRIEKEASRKGYVDMYGRITAFKPRKRRYEKLADIMQTKVSTSLGECHRPIMLGDCQYRYACLNCGHHRVTLEDKPQISLDIKNLNQDFEKAKVSGQERRLTGINRLLLLLSTRLKGLEELENLSGDTVSE